MNSIGQARLLYKKNLEDKYALLEFDQNRLEADINRFIYIGIKEITPVSKLFVFTQILDILKQVLRLFVLINKDVRPLGKAFEVLEVYFNLLIDQPWKPEFKKLKMYGGFYRTKIKSVLPEPEIIFRIAGYEVDHDRHLLVLKRPVHKDTMLSLAFDCRVAATQCRTIELHYNKLKGLDKTLGDAVCDILHDTFFASVSARADDIVRPPLIPKREPPVNGLADVTLSSTPSAKPAPVPMCQTVARPTAVNHAQGQGISTMTLPYELPRRQVVVNPPVTINNHENLICLGDSDIEFLPVLPEGTSEDHMRESLKMVAKHHALPTHQQSTVSEPSFRTEPTIGDIAWLENPTTHLTVEGSNRYSAHTYPPGYAYMKNQAHVNGINPPSMDEGIGSELSTVSKPSTRYYIPTKMPSSFPQPSDYGYRTGPSMQTTTQYPHYSGNTSDWDETAHRCSGRHSGIETDDGGLKPVVDMGIGMQIRLRQKSNPETASVFREVPPVPSRELKPNYQRLDRMQGVDNVDGVVADTTNIGGGADNVNLDVVLRRNGHSLYGGMASQTTSDYSGGAKSHPLPVVTTDESNVRLSRVLLTGRSGSLKTGEPKSPLAQVIAQSRVTRSMDFTHTQWECRSCTATNVASDAVCCVCSRSRHGMADQSTPSSGQSLKPCPYCTFENTADKTSCEMCNSELFEAQHSYI